MADDAPLAQEMAGPSGQASPACVRGDGGGMPPLQEGGEALLQRQQKEDEMIMTLIALLAERTARDYLTGYDDTAAAEHAA